MNWKLSFVVTGLVVVTSGCPEPIGDRCGPDLPPCASGQSCVDGRCLASAGGGGAAGGASAGGRAGGAGGGTAGGSTGGGLAGGVAGGLAGGVAGGLGGGGGDAGGTAGGVAGGDAGGTSGGVAGGDAGGSSGGVAGGLGGGAAGGGGGGSAGGAAGGSSGGAAGGSAGGAGGGSAGGTPVPSCPASCPVYAPCEADLDGGRCVNLSLAFVSPPNGAVYDAGITVPVEVSARLRDGGSFAVAIPLSTNASAPATIAAGVASNVTLPVAGTWSFTAGWDGGPSASVSVQTISCVAACQPWQFCTPSLDGGSCPSLNLSLTWTSPDAGLAFNSASVPARLSVTRSGGPVPPGLTSIPLSGPTGPLPPLTGAAGVFTGSLPMAAPEGSKTFVAGWPAGGPTASVAIERDTVPPGVILLPLTRPASWPDPYSRDPGAWKMNETALLAVVVDAGPPVTVADLSVVDSGVTITQVAPAACGCSGCQCFQVPLRHAAELPARSGSRSAAFVTVRPIADSAGNQSPALTDELPVTRFLWERAFGGNGLGLAENGTLIVQSSNEVRAVAPDGGTLWLWSAGANSLTVRPPVVGAGSVYVTDYDGSQESSIRRLSLATGSVLATTCTADYQRPFDTPLALATSSIGAEVPIGRRKDRVFAGTASCPELGLDVGTGLSAAVELGLTGEISVYMASGGPPQKFTFDGFSFSDAGIAQGPAAAQVFLLSGTLGTLSNVTLVLQPNHLGGPTSFGGLGGTMAVAGNDSIHLASGVLYRCDYDATPAISGCVAYGPSLNPSSRAIKSSSGVWVPVLGGAAEIRPDGGVFGVPFSAQLNDFTVDVPRLPSGAKACGQDFGTVYLLGANSTEAWLIDSQGLDGTAPWPNTAHDPANSRNLSRSTAPWSCP
ncbi:MAG: hypothetical protein JNJ54_26060 [Myxococcaceae bacterium]|nr:hypothetical protein [Myxococcaceae bacterium]